MLGVLNTKAGISVADIIGAVDSRTKLTMRDRLHRHVESRENFTPEKMVKRVRRRTKKFQGEASDTMVRLTISTTIFSNGDVTDSTEEEFFCNEDMRAGRSGAVFDNP